ncbi:helix-turn-helix transcriptional regulator [Streptomyces sp. ISL-14]|nr:helix-turn-helix transcriptional regulator [Streptomyces sp. ISL-14]
MTGIKIRRYMLLRRLYLSTNVLESGKRIIDIAFDYDYSSKEAYSRAFKTVFGISPREFQLNRMPVQSFNKLTIHKNKGWCRMDFSRKIGVDQIQNKQRELFDKYVLNILNGQAMCVNTTTKNIFNEEFIKTRAIGHHELVENYIDKVINPLNNLFYKDYECIVLWFGEDMFCQMNLLTILAYLEQADYSGRVFLNSFRENEFKVRQTKLRLGNYLTVYEEVLLNHKKTSIEVLPVMYQAIDIYLEMLKEDNPVTNYISKNKSLPESQLINRLFIHFPTIGYGDLQYKKLISKIK